MYAKLNFSSTVAPAEVARDIARVLSESNGAGGATLGTCEFINLADSFISDTEASTWSLYSPTILNTGSVTSTDKYIMKSPHAQPGKFKYVEVGYNGSSFSDVYGGFRVMPVLDAGESTERLLGGYNGNTSSYTQNNTFIGTVHIVANSKCLLVFGRSRALYSNNPVSHMSFLMESAVTTSSAYKQHAPYVFLNLYDVQGNHSTTYSQDSFTGPSSSTGISWSSLDPGIFAIDMYNPVSSTKAKVIQFKMNNSWGNPYSNWYTIQMCIDNGTTAGASLAAPTGWQGSGMISSPGDLLAWQNNALLGSYRRGLDSSGNTAMTLFPLSTLDPLMLCEFIDLSTSPVYMTYGQQGLFGDTLTISGDDYFYIPIAYASIGAYMVKLK